MVLFPILLAAAAAPVDRAKMYLLSVVDLPLQAGESVEEFSFSTWGVDVKAVCHVPDGWYITAGRNANPEGEISGRGTNGVTWLRERSPKVLQNFVLVTLYAPVQRNDIAQRNGFIPQTFKGEASTARLTGGRRISLTYKNIHLLPAAHCPSSERERLLPLRRSR